MGHAPPHESSRASATLCEDWSITRVCACARGRPSRALQWKSENGAHHVTGIGFETQYVDDKGATQTASWSHRATHVSDACKMGDFK